ncbi:MAG: bifunctional diaminohydroxyphosphoribosylaminopyrimidine deaminase/5-amino-6-(5-phosphoribosylamino)uracil reductase RibD [Prevotella sp.]
MKEEKDIIYMRRCLQIAANGRQNARPNPMVGAVIVCDDRIIGEGYHVRCGEGHAEVNAFASVKPEDEHLLAQSTIYVSLEPCSHYGKTPPCADLIVSKGVKRVVVGCVDPFAEVSGRGINKLRDAGIEVRVGVLEEECRRLNNRFMTFNEKHRPYIILKWAQSQDGYMDKDFMPYTFSTPFTQMLSHKLRAENDAILVGHTTALRDHPSLTVRTWWGKNPMRLVLDSKNPCFLEIDPTLPMLPQLMQCLYERKVQSLIVEGGAYTHRQFIDAGFWDEIRVETAPVTVSRGTVSPSIPSNAVISGSEYYDGNVITTYLCH